jgi:hypothetical protein
MTGTTLYYNGVWLRDCETKLFDQQIQYDESGTDVILTRFRIRVTSTLVAYTDSQQPEHESTIRAGSSTLNSGSAPIQLGRISSLLNEKGKLFYFYIKDAPSALTVPSGLHPDILLSAIGPQADDAATIPLHPEDPMGSTILASTVVDVENGPKPTHVTVEQIYGGRSMRVTFEIEVCRRICRSDFSDDYPVGEPEGLIPSTPNILSNRWFVTESRDANWVTTRILQGTLRVVSKKTLPHMMRYLVVPSLLRGYQRVSMNFASDPTDLILKYRIEDKQRHESPPAPAIDWSGEYIESAGRHGMNQHATFRLRLIGPPGIDKQLLLGAAGRVMKQRFAGLQKDPGDPDLKFSGRLEGSTILDVIGEPIIEMQLRFYFAEEAQQRTISEGSDGDGYTPPDALRLRLSQIGKPLAIAGYDPQVWPSPLPYDSSTPSGIFACYLQSPCSQWHGIPVYPSGTQTSPSSERPASVSNSDQPDVDMREYPSEDSLDFDNIKVDEDEQFSGYPYTYIDIRSRYIQETGRVQMPLASADIVSGDTCRIIKLHSGISKRVFMMEATRIGKVPLIPTPLDILTDPNGITESLLSSSIELHAPEFQVDAFSQEYRVLCEYVYLLSRPPSITERLRMAVSPIDIAANGDRYIDCSDLFTSEKIEYHA